MKKSVLIAGIIISLALIGGGVFWYVKNQNRQPVNNPPITNNRQEQIATSTKENDTSNWQTYSNEKYGFEVKYPEAYLIKKIKGGIYLKHPTYDLVPNYPAEGGAISIALTNTKIEDHIKSIKKIDPPLSRVISQKEYILDGMKGVEIISTFAEGLDYYDIFIKYNNKEYLISYGGIGFDYIKEILSTFKFIK